MPAGPITANLTSLRVHVYPVLFGFNDAMSRQLFLVCYDISSPRRAYRVRKVLRSFAFPVQKSILECMLTLAERGKLIKDIEKLIDPDEDRFLLLHIDPRAFAWRMGAIADSACSELVYWG